MLRVAPPSKVVVNETETAPLVRRGLSQESSPLYTKARYTDQKIRHSKNADLEWDRETSKACSTAVTGLGGVISNPSGVNACYNVRNFNTTGGFDIDLRLYRVASPVDDWMSLQASAVALDVTYDHADIAANRDAVSLPSSDKDQAKDMYVRRVKGAAPKQFAVLTYTGSVNGDISGEDMTEDSLRSILTPDITLSAVTHAGTPLSTKLSADDAVYFVNGLFAQEGTTINNVHTTVSMVGQADQPSHSGNPFIAFPTTSIISVVWAVLVTMTIVYGLVKKVQAKNKYRIKLASNEFVRDAKSQV